jgi:hypothetical protein
MQTAEMRKMVELMKRQVTMMQNKENIERSQSANIGGMGTGDAFRTSLLQSQASRGGKSGGGGLAGMLGGGKAMAGMMLGGFGAMWVANNLMKSFSGLAEAETGEQYDINLRKTWLGPLNDILYPGAERHLQIREQWENARSGLYGTSGKMYGSIDSEGNVTRPGFEWTGKYGLTAIEAMPLYTKMQQLSGGTQTDLKSVIKYSNAYNLDRDMLTKMSASDRFDESTFVDTAALIGKRMHGSDRADIKNVIESVDRLTQSQLSMTGSVNTTDIAGIALGLRGVGGAFSGTLAAGTIQKMQSTMSGGGNEYMQAMKYSMIRELNPTANWWEIKEIQEQGIYAPGMMEKVLEKSLSHGNKQTGKMLLKEFTGLGYTATGDLMEHYIKNPGMFEGYDELSEEEKKKYINEILNPEALTGTSGAKSKRAIITNAFIKSAEEGMKAVALQSGILADVKVILEGMAKVANEYSKVRENDQIIGQEIVDAGGVGNFLVGSMVKSAHAIK